MLDDTLQNAKSQILGCIAIGAVDLATGTLLSIHSEEDRSQEMLNIMTSTVSELFEAPLLRAFSEIYTPKMNEEFDQEKQFTELLLMNKYHNYLLLRGRERTQLAVIVIASKDTPVGILIMKALAVMPAIENSL